MDCLNLGSGNFLMGSRGDRKAREEIGLGGEQAWVRKEVSDHFENG